MNPNFSRSFQGGLALALILFALAGAGCARKQKIPTAVPSQPATSSAALTASTGSSSERRVQSRIESMQEEVRGLSLKVEASERAYWGSMPAEWQQKVRVAKTDGTTASERMRYLEALETVLARKLRSLQEEVKTYEAYQMSDPLVPRK